MRIISGIRRGHKLLEFDGFDIRPTTDRVRESMFNLICDYVPGATVLDLFAGSGALSFEALSRGAKSSVLCDVDKRSLDLINSNAKRLNFENMISVNHISYDDFLKRNTQRFDIVFLDPPYNKGFITPCIEMIVSKGTLNDGGIIVLESDSVDFHGEISNIGVLKQKKYGRSYVTVYKKGA